MLQLSTLQPKQRKHTRRVGRGNGSGRGTFSGRGIKGQRARSGSRSGLKLRGLRALFKGIPKTRGQSGDVIKLPVMNLGDIEKNYPAQTVIALHGVKVLGVGATQRPLEITAEAFSTSAKTKLEQAGGKAITCGKHS